ncbi:MAG: tRNA (adenosine(37)-N6)-threonylcarbamoyltransferase complex dimerization subunit type 1 TsaB [Ignavibacteriales bacterium]|nr:tRNA (adenosine(37)-N6)-threonylcarbamoyltransferase complex dimerization subunit type 1 TsaB [Ignavibacteriales bacterium]
MNKNNSVVLAIETTGTLCSVCVYKSDSEYFNLSLMKEKVHSKKILSMIEFAMSEIGVKYSELSGVCISEGPGSFTGLRLGFAAAKGIAFGQNIGILRVPTFKCLAYEVSENMPIGTRGLVVTKAALEESYLYGFESTDDGFSELLPLQLMMNHDLNDVIENGDMKKFTQILNLIVKERLKNLLPRQYQLQNMRQKSLILHLTLK